MPRIGMSELLVILVIALIVFGPSRLPALGRMLGRTTGKLKSYAGTITEELEQLDKAAETGATTQSTPSMATAADHAPSSPAASAGKDEQEPGSQTA